MRSPIAALALLALAACSGTVGEGRRPTALQLTSQAGGDALETYECAAVELAAVATFSGDGGDSLETVSSRALWSSSNSSVARVSNGDIPLPDGSGLYYAQGTVVVLAPGTATITAEYAGLRARYAISANPIGELRIEPAMTRIAPQTKQAFRLETTLLDSQVPVDLSSVAAWKLVTAGAPATLEGTTVTALSGPLDTAFVLEAALPLCGRNQQRSLQLGRLRELRLSHEQPEGALLPLGYSAWIGILGLFEDDSAEPQELGLQLEMERLAGDEGDAELAVDDTGLLLRPLFAGVPQQLRFSLESSGLSVDSRVIEARELELRSLRVTPEQADLDLRETLQAEAWGLFEDGIERPLRRNLAWSSRNEFVAKVGNGIDGGEISAQSYEGDTVIDVRAGLLTGLSAEIAVSSFRSKPE
ncbi:MAG TPA: Ig-like domain-containing protein [Solimonas sp.]|nr:Ig-like domain-containing protein [Solimonas sp.]